MLDWGAFQTLAADNEGGTVTISGNTLTLLVMLLELAEIENWFLEGAELGVADADEIEDIVAQATAEILP
jgi:hypothetical protein